MARFSEILSSFNWEKTAAAIRSKTAKDVETALSRKGARSTGDMMALLSPAALPYLEEMAKMSHDLTVKRFGKTIRMYIPLYLSNECQNVCTYCGFSYQNKINRVTLSDDQIIKEAEAIKKMGFDHVLLVTGEATKSAGMAYFRNAIKLVRPYFSTISMEIQPLEQKDYEELISLGVYSVLVYQETYNRGSYGRYHPKGKKSNFDFRLETPERLGRAGIYKTGLGALLGLEDWRTDSFFCALHLDFLRKKYWRTKYSVSFPRLRPAAGVHLESFLENGNHHSHYISDRELVQLICAWRLFDEDVELANSTRESPRFRDHIIHLGITTMSAASRTNPGGYAIFPQSLEQFETDDSRSASEIAAMIRQRGYEPVWKDWDRQFNFSETDDERRHYSQPRYEIFPVPDQKVQ